MPPALAHPVLASPEGPDLLSHAQSHIAAREYWASSLIPEAKAALRDDDAVYSIAAIRLVPESSPGAVLMLGLGFISQSGGLQARVLPGARQ